MSGSGGPGTTAPGPGLARALAEHSERLSHCVHCGFCLPACPTYVQLGDEADSPRGRLHLMAAVVEGRLSPESDAFQTHLDRCLGCRACEPVCPSGVEYGFLLERARAVALDARPPSAGTRLLLALVRRPSLFRMWMWASRLLRRSGLVGLGVRILPRWGAVGRIRFGLGMLGASAPAPLETLPDADGGAGGAGGAVAQEAGAVPAGGPAGGSVPRPVVGVLTGCVQEGLFHRVNRATVRVLEANGFRVAEVPGQGCCGALHAHGGSLAQARELARRNVEAFESSGVDVVAVNAAGCGAAMKEYGELLGGGGEWEARGRAFSEKVRDISEVLAGGGREPEAGASLPLRVVYDPPCHLLHAQRVVDPPLRMLRAVPDLDVVPARDGETCCGGAGIYGITHEDLGSRIGGEKADAVREAGAEIVVTGNPGCAMQIGAVLRVDGKGMGGIRGICHPVEILDESYRRAGRYGAGSGG